jgi:hypothetical protein
VSWEATGSELSTTDFHESPITHLPHDDGELGWHPTCIAIPPESGLFSRWSNDPQSARMSLTASRRIHFNSSSTVCNWSAAYWLTYHAITFSATGTISGSNGGTVNVYLHDATSGELLASGSRSGNGSYTLTWFDSVNNYFVDAREDATHLGRSDNAVLA